MIKTVTVEGRTYRVEFHGKGQPLRVVRLRNNGGDLRAVRLDGETGRAAIRAARAG